MNPESGCKNPQGKTVDLKQPLARGQPDSLETLFESDDRFDRSDRSDRQTEQRTGRLSQHATSLAGVRRAGQITNLIRGWRASHLTAYHTLHHRALVQSLPQKEASVPGSALRPRGHRVNRQAGVVHTCCPERIRSGVWPSVHLLNPSCHQPGVRVRAPRPTPPRDLLLGGTEG